jgi:hypothetical protein
MYRNDLDAAQARIASLEAELAAKDLELRELKGEAETEQELVPVEADLALEEAAVDELHALEFEAEEADDGTSMAEILAERCIHSKRSRWRVHTLYMGSRLDERAYDRFKQKVPPEVLAVTLREGGMELVVHGTLTEEHVVGCVKRYNYLERPWGVRIKAALRRWWWVQYETLYVNILVYGDKLPEVEGTTNVQLVDGANDYLQVKRHETYALCGAPYRKLRAMFMHKALQYRDRLVERAHLDSGVRIQTGDVKRLEERTQAALEKKKKSKERRSLAGYAIKQSNPKPPPGGTGIR